MFQCTKLERLFKDKGSNSLGPFVSYKEKSAGHTVLSKSDLGFNKSISGFISLLVGLKQDYNLRA